VRGVFETKSVKKFSFYFGPCRRPAHLRREAGQVAGCSFRLHHSHPAIYVKDRSAKEHGSRSLKLQHHGRPLICKRVFLTDFSSKNPLSIYDLSNVLGRKSKSAVYPEADGLVEMAGELELKQLATR